MKKFSLALVCTILTSFTVFGQSKLKPHHKGYDIFAAGKYIYIVRSDIGAYLRAKKLDGDNSTKSEIFPMNEALRNANHYFGVDKRSKKGKTRRIAIWGTTYTEHKKFSDPEGTEKTIVSEEARNGNHYFNVKLSSGRQVIYVIKGRKILVFGSLSDSTAITTGLLPDELQKDVVAFWGKGKHIYILKNDKERGPLIYKAKRKKSSKPKEKNPSISKMLSYEEESYVNWEISNVISAPNDGVRNFLIGGLSAVTNGGTAVVWKSISSAFPFCNNSRNPKSRVQAPKHEESIKIGFVEGSTSSIEHNWSVSVNMGYSKEIGPKAVGAAVIKKHIELTTEYGGASIKTTSKQWTTENTTTITLDEGKNVWGGKCIGYWQGQILINGKLVMTTGIHFTDNDRPPVRRPAFHYVK